MNATSFLKEVSRTEHLDDRYSERRSLPSTSLCDSEEIATSEDERDRLLLYGCRIRISLFGECVEDGLYESEFGEEHSRREEIGGRMEKCRAIDTIEYKRRGVYDYIMK